MLQYFGGGGFYPVSSAENKKIKKSNIENVTPMSRLNIVRRKGSIPVAVNHRKHRGRLRYLKQLLILVFNGFISWLKAVKRSKFLFKFVRYNDIPLCRLYPVDTVGPLGAPVTLLHQVTHIYSHFT